MHINPLYHKSFYNNALALVSGEQILLCPSPSSIPFFFVLRYMHVADLLNYCCCCPFWLSMAPQLCALDLVTALLCFGICPPPSSPVVELHVTYGVRVFTKQPKAIDIWVATIENLPSIARDFNQPHSVFVLQTWPPRHYAHRVSIHLPGIVIRTEPNIEPVVASVRGLIGLIG